MSRMPQWGLVLRALWWRRGLTAAVLGVAVVTTTAAALGPLYARAAGESILQDHLSQAGYKAGLHLHAELRMTRQNYTHAAGRVPEPGSLRGYDRQIRGLYTDLGEMAQAPGHGAVQTALTWRDGACGHLVIVRGRCPTAPNEAIASQAAVDSPRGYGWQLGTMLRLSSIAPRGFLAPPNPRPVRIVGVYRPKDTSDPFWFGTAYFAAGLGGGAQDAPDLVATLFVSRGEFFSLDPATVVEADFDYPLTTTAVRLRSQDAERAAVSRVLHQFRGKTRAYADFRAIPTTSLTARTGLPRVLDAAAAERHLAGVGTLLVTVQLALLAWLVLFQIISDAIEARGNEIAMAKLRGLSPGSTIRFGLGEPVVLLAAAVPIGILAALGVTHLFASAALVHGVPVVLPISALYTALIAFAGGMLAAGLAGYRTLTRSVLEQWRRTNRAPGAGRLMLAVDVLIAGGAIAGLLLLRSVHGSANSDDTATLLAPGLLVAAVGILGVRLLPLGCRWLAHRTRASRRVGVFLAARQVARRPVGLRLAALLAVAVGLATFAVAGETVATTNRTARAHGELGAARVANIQFDPGLDPIRAVAHADPDGRWAMTAATWLPDGGDSVAGTVLGIDASRLPAVGYPAAGGPSVADTAREIGAAPVQPITITSKRIRIHLTASGLRGDRRPYVTVNLRTERTPFYDVDGSTIAPGRHAYPVRLACRTGCQLLGITWNRPFDATDRENGTITLHGIDVATGTGWRRLNIGLDTPRSWRAAVPAGQASDHVTVHGGGVVDRFGNENGGYGGITYSAAPSPIPAIATRRAIITGPGHPARPQVLDNSQTTAYFRIVRYAPVLPAVLDDGVLMDVRYLEAELPSFASEAQWQVWLGADAPPDALARLDRAGLHVEHVRTASSRIHQLGRQGPALALLLLLVCAIAGAVLAVGGTAISISASSRRRSYEIAALRAVGVHRRSLRRASVVEQLLLLGGAAVLGIPTGLIAARLAMPVIPEFSDSTPIALHYTPHWAPTLLFAVAFLVLLTATAIVAAYALIRVAVPARLREADA